MTCENDSLAVNRAALSLSYASRSIDIVFVAMHACTMHAWPRNVNWWVVGSAAKRAETPKCGGGCRVGSGGGQGRKRWEGLEGVRDGGKTGS